MRHFKTILSVLVLVAMVACTDTPIAPDLPSGPAPPAPRGFSEPRCVAITPDGAFAYVTNRGGSNTVSVTRRDQ